MLAHKFKVKITKADQLQKRLKPKDPSLHKDLHKKIMSILR